MTKIYIGADHRGFALKEQLKKHLTQHDVQDLGSPQVDPNDDYPEIAARVAESVTKDPQSRGIVICGSGVGVDIAANKIKNARAGLALNEKQIEEARAADNINILAIAADYTPPQQAKDIIDVFLTTKYDPKPRRNRRLKKIEELEK